MPASDTLGSKEQLDELLTEKTASTVIRNILKNVKTEDSDYPNIDTLEIQISGKPTIFPGSGTVKIQFTLGEILEGGAFCPSDTVINSAMTGMKSQDLDIECKAVTFTLRLTTDQFQELSKSTGDETSRNAVKEVLS